MTIKLEGLSKTYNPKSDFPVHAVQSVDLEIKQVDLEIRNKLISHLYSLGTDDPDVKNRLKSGLMVKPVTSHPFGPTKKRFSCA